MSDKAAAYVNYGRWVADCPAPGCEDARAVFPEDKRGIPSPKPVLRQACANGHPMTVEMPPEQEAARILTALSGRGHDADKAWYPRGHARATLAGFPTGQTVEELRAESSEVKRLRAEQGNDRSRQLAALLQEYGVPVTPDGHFEGSI